MTDKRITLKLIVTRNSQQAGTRLQKLAMQGYTCNYAHRTATMGNTQIRVIDARERDHRIAGLVFSKVILEDVPAAWADQYKARERA